MTPTMRASPTSTPAGYARKLTGRHIQLISIGGTIGVGLFLGSGRAIHAVGPGLVFVYLAAGAVIFIILRALGELMVYRPVTGSFASYAGEFIGPRCGFITGWSYWFMWVVVGMAETTAIGIYVRYWLPDVPQWCPACVVLLTLYAANMLTVRVFAELEFWFALIKILTILGLIVGGLMVISLGSTGSFSNLWTQGGVFPRGTLAVFGTLQAVAFAYSGVELLGMTAGEAQRPSEVLPRAVNGVILRMLIFYVGALAIIMSLVPWNRLDPRQSPFVYVFDLFGLHKAATVINLVVITAAASSCNSGIYSTGRMLMTLAQQGHAPSALATLNRQRVPARGIQVSAIAMLLGVALNYVVPDKVFIWLTSTALIGTLWTWIVILLVHVRYRKAVAMGSAAGVSYRLPGAPATTWVALVFLLIVAVALWKDPETRVALYVAPVWFGLLICFYHLTIGSKWTGGMRQDPSPS